VNILAMIAMRASVLKAWHPQDIAHMTHLSKIALGLGCSLVQVLIRRTTELKLAARLQGDALGSRLLSSSAHFSAHDCVPIKY